MEAAETNAEKIKTPPFKAVVFDIDGTLTPEVSWIALTRDLGADVDAHLAIYEAFRRGDVSYEESKKQLLHLWQATGQTTRKDFEKLFQRWPVHPEAPTLVRGLKMREKDICLITGSLDLYAETVARRLGVDNFYANTELVWSEVEQLVDYHYELNQARKKLQQFQAFCEERGFVAADCIVVGDSDNDLRLFTHTGRGLLVGDIESAALREAAWQTVPTLQRAEALLLS